MVDKYGKHSTVAKSFEIDQRAIKIFLWWLPDNWPPRKQDPDFYIDYLVEIVEDGEPTGKHFGVQVKGYEDASNNPKLLKYNFKFKHLDYYLNRSQHPVFVFLINTVNREGYWVFAQKYLKENNFENIPKKQKTWIVRFSPEDSLFNSTKFKCLLPEAETFVRDLHPGSVHAAIKKRKYELELIDPRCSVSISIKDGQEHILITPKDAFPFITRIHSKDAKMWQNFIERGTDIKLGPGELEIIGAPLLEELNKQMGSSTIRNGTNYGIAIQIVSGTAENPFFIQLPGMVTAGTKFMTIAGTLPDSPFEINGEIPFDNQFQVEASLKIHFSIDTWAGQNINMLSHFDQIEMLVHSLAEFQIPKMQILIRGNIVWTGCLANTGVEEIKIVSRLMQRFYKCRWLARHFNVNPVLPNLKYVSKDKWEEIEELYDLVKNKETCLPAPRLTISFTASSAPTDDNSHPGGTLTIKKDGQMVDFFGTQVRLGPAQHTFSDVSFVSCTQQAEGGSKYIFKTNENSKQTSILC